VTKKDGAGGPLFVTHHDFYGWCPAAEKDRRASGPRLKTGLHCPRPAMIRTVKSENGIVQVCCPSYLLIWMRYARSDISVSLQGIPQSGKTSAFSASPGFYPAAPHASKHHVLRKSANPVKTWARPGLKSFRKSARPWSCVVEHERAFPLVQGECDIRDDATALLGASTAPCSQNLIRGPEHPLNTKPGAKMVAPFSSTMELWRGRSVLICDLH